MLFRDWLLLFTSFSCTGISFASQYSLNDVSILFPLPQNPLEYTNYLKASSPLGAKRILSSELFMNLPHSDDNEFGAFDLGSYSSLTVVGLRFDPCFKDHFDENCRSQVRLVLQTIDVNFLSHAEDFALHVFYDVPKTALNHLIQFSQNYRLAQGLFDSSLPLQIHPLLLKEGMNGQFWNALKNEVSNTLGLGEVSRVAFFGVLTDATAWDVRSFDIVGASINPLVIPDLKGTIFQELENHSGTISDFRTQMLPLPDPAAGTDQVFDFLNDSVKFRESGGTSGMNQFTRTIRRIENPLIHLPGTIDCVSCHATGPIEKSLNYPTGTLASYVSLTLPASSLEQIYSKNIQNTNFRMFGYNGNNPVTSQRTINESAKIVDNLNLHSVP